MASDNDCPRCGKDIGIWAVFKATLPNRIFCPHCGARLEYGGTWNLIAFAIVATVALVVAAAVAYTLAGGASDLVPALAATGGVLVIGGMLLEVGLVLQLWYGGYRLQEVGKPRAEDDPDW